MPRCTAVLIAVACLLSPACEGAPVCVLPDAAVSGHTTGIDRTTRGEARDPVRVPDASDEDATRGAIDGAPCVPCTSVGRLFPCPTRPGYSGLCTRRAGGALCASFGAETCNGVDDDCDGETDENGATLCDDGVPCTRDTCERWSGSAICAHDPDAPDSAAACDDGLTCTVDACDPQGGILVASDSRDTVVDDAARPGCRHVMRHSFCTDEWDGCACNGAHETCVASGGEAGVGCALAPQWLFPHGRGGDCEQNWPCADRTGHPCDNCYAAACCEPLGGHCNPEHVSHNALERAQIEEACASRACASGGPATCPSVLFVGNPTSRCDATSDGNPCTFKPHCFDPMLGCAAPLATAAGTDVGGEHDAMGNAVSCRGLVDGAQGCARRRCDGAGRCTTEALASSSACSGHEGCCVHQCVAGACTLDCATPECGMPM